MLDIRNISFTYGKGNYVLNDFSFSISKGGVYGLLGRNGVGKSTLLYLIAGLLTPDRGEVLLNGDNTRRRHPSTLSQIFIVPEEFDLPAISLKRYVGLYAPLYPRFSYADMKRYLEMFELNDDINLGRLSMGQKKKAYMSFALACNTPILLMDEPSNGLDIPGKSAFRRVVSASASDERIIIISTHQVRDIDHILDHILVMSNSNVVLDASVSEITNRLSFLTTNEPSLIDRALFTMPSPEGWSIVVENIDNNDTDLNLETLFGFVLSNPTLARSIFAENRSFSPTIPPIPDSGSCSPFNSDDI